MGSIITTGFFLGWFVNEWYYLIDAFIGLNLLQASVTGVCPGDLVKKLGS